MTTTKTVATGLLALLLGRATPAQDPPPAGALALIERAVAAHGGARLLADPPHYVLRGTATSTFRGTQRSGASVIYRAPAKQRSETSLEMRGAMQDFITTWDGESAMSEFFGRRSERPALPAEVEARHRPEAVLTWALAHAGEGRVVVGDGDLTVIEFAAADGSTRLALDGATGLVSYIEYPYPTQTDLSELETKLRRDSYQRWRATGGGFALPGRFTTTVDGVEQLAFEIESAELQEPLADDLFRLEEDLAPPLASDELAE